jgi:preprotein translocase subunit SecY
MSEEGSTGITVAEKFFGLLLVIIGALAVYYTFEASQALVAFTGFFAFLSIILLVLGILLIIAKPELL